jgi:hypothetical protein
MKRRTPIRRNNNEPVRQRQVRRTFVDPSKMKASELKALVCLFLHGKPAPFLTGHAFCSEVVHVSINPRDTFISWKVIKELIRLKLVYFDKDINVQLTGAGRGISRGLSNKPIHGYD